MTEKAKLGNYIEFLKDNEYFSEYVDLLFTSLDEPQSEVAFTFALKGFQIYLSASYSEYNEDVMSIICSTIELMMQHLRETEQYEKLNVIKNLGLILPTNNIS